MQVCDFHLHYGFYCIIRVKRLHLKSIPELEKWGLLTILALREHAKFVC
jgi:hypothetical protein